MIAMIMGLLASKTGTLAAGTLGVSMILWGLGRIRNFQAFKSFREAWGRFAMGLGEVVSKIGNTRLKVLWQPIEDILCDLVLFFAEQFAVGLRRDNPEKIEKQIERLEEVESIARSRMLTKKLELLRYHAPSLRDAKDAAIAFRLNEKGSESIGDKLNL